MTIIHCDECGTEIEKPKDSIAISRGLGFAGIELCGDCGAPAAELLDRVRTKQADREARDASLHAARKAVQ